MRRTTLATVLAAALAASVLAGCTWTSEDSLSATEGLPDVRQQLTAHTWLLDRTDGTLQVETTGETTLDFDADGTLSGTGACNGYHGTYTIDDDELHVGALVSTKRACAGTANEADAEYLAALAKVRRVDATDRDRLVLKADGVQLAYDAFDARDAIAGTWTVTNVATDDALVSVEGAVLTIDDDGSLSLRGCNTMSASWTLTGDAFDVGPVMSTLIGCEQKAAEQDTALGAALDAATAVDVSPGQLALLAGDGRTVLVAVPADA